jgi:hypothetical protein
MTTQAGWYPDPQAPHLIRWWDGGQWTSHTAARPTQLVQQAPAAQQAQSGQQTERAHQPLPAFPAASAWWGADDIPRHKPRGPKIFAITGLTLLAGYLLLVAAFSLGGKSRTTGVDAPPACGLRLTSQMSPTTVAFVQVLIASNARSEALSNTLQQEGTAVTVNDVRTKAGNEMAFAQGIDQIPFTGEAAADATRLSAQSRQLAADLLQSINEPPDSNLVARIRQDDYDPAPREALRVDAGLPAQGTCTFRSIY